MKENLSKTTQDNIIKTFVEINASILRIIAYISKTLKGKNL